MTDTVDNPFPADDDAPYFEGHQPRECREHRTLGSHRAWCYDCSEYCYPRIAAACNGCRNPVIEKLLDDMAEALEGFWGIGFQLSNDDHPEVVDVLARYRAYKGSE